MKILNLFLLSVCFAAGVNANELDGSLKNTSGFSLLSFLVLWVTLNTSVCPDPGGGCEIHICVCVCFWASDNVWTLCWGRSVVAGEVTIPPLNPKTKRSKLAMSRVPSPPPPAEMTSGPVAESWCYTQVSVYGHLHSLCVLPVYLFGVWFEEFGSKTL